MYLQASLGAVNFYYENFNDLNIIMQKQDNVPIITVDPN